eukprot:scaffold1982_cov93-Amphora_coffeaeformis.AAC.23
MFRVISGGGGGGGGDAVVVFRWLRLLLLFAAVAIPSLTAFTTTTTTTITIASRTTGSTAKLSTQQLASSFVDSVEAYTIRVPRSKVAAADGTTVTTDEQLFQLSFRYVPRHTRKPPVVVLHGGPSLTSSYLYNLADLGFRSMLFYDQLGVGKSDEPTEDAFYSLEWAVQDLEYLIEAVLGRHEPYHLYAHAYGGALAYEFLKQGSSTSQYCRSVVMSSAPTDIPAVRATYERLVETLGPIRFAATHVCRIPAPMLAAAYAYPGRVWTGMTHYAEYRAQQQQQQQKQASSSLLLLRQQLDDDDEEDSEDKQIVLLQTPCLGLQGEFDFVDTRQWENYFQNFQALQLPNCSHHGLYENPGLYAETLRNFWSEYDV